NPISGEADLSQLDPAIIERVEIVRGAQSSRYGSQALGGVVLVTTRHPGRIVPQLALGSGQWGERRVAAQTAVDRTVMHHGASAMIGGSWQQLTGDFTTAVPVERGGGTTRRDNADSRRLAINAAGSVQHGAATLDLRGDLAHVDRGMPGSIVQPSLTGRQVQRRVGATATIAAATGSTGAVRASLGVQRQTGRFRDAVPPFGAAYDQQQRVTSVVGSIGANTTVQHVALTSGAEFRRLGASGTGLSANAPGVVSTGGAWLGVSRPFVSDRWRFDIGGGARADVGTLWRGAFLSPDLHATVQRGKARVGAGWRSAFSAPSLGDLFFQEGVQVRANPALRPERVRGEWTASMDVERIAVAGTVTTLGVSAYRGDIDDLILWSPDFRFVWSPDNFDVSRRGVDASMRIALPSNSASVTLTGGAVDIRYRGAVLAGQVIYRPRLTGAMIADLVRGATDLRLALQATGMRRTVVGSDINQLPAFQLVQLQLARGIDLGPLDTKVRLSVENLLDQPVAMLLDFPFPGRTWSVDLTLRPRSRLPARFKVSAQSFFPASRSSTR
ncbi:MAG: TonB-dependent receptor, partial [Gemmatimonadaceae bacterium]|nr:TonB-dependent receptor [Gemmatimonadaceae bacterium]